MTSHSRLSPGVELHEIDRSGYRTDYSITNTTVLVCGFADKGEDYTPQWVNSMATFRDLYGDPTNEVEEYFRSAAAEVVGRGGVCVAAKLPYANDSMDRFATATLDVAPSVVSAGPLVGQLRAVDPSLTSYLEISASGPDSGLIDMDELDGYRVGTRFPTPGTIKVVDIARDRYDKIDVVMADGSAAPDSRILGTAVVFTSPVNAMFYQKIISADAALGKAAYQPVSDLATREGVRFTEISRQHLDVNIEDDADAGDGRGDSLAARAVGQFPSLFFKLPDQFDRTHLRHVGVVVFRVAKDSANDRVLDFRPVESFVGSLDRRSHDQSTGASDYIDRVVNGQSRYVNVFSNLGTGPHQKAVEEARTLLVSRQTFPVLGFRLAELTKRIGYTESVMRPLAAVFDKAQDPNQVRIDVVCDAGVSNVAAYAKFREDLAKGTPAQLDENVLDYPFAPPSPVTGGPPPWTWNDAQGYLDEQFAVLRKFTDFCSGTRRDCIFVADMFRPAVLDGDEKIVRSTSRYNTIEDTLVPRMRKLSRVNSSWAAGYSNWFYAPRGDTGDFFWCPPSIKAAGVYVYTDAYSHPWDAPAGTTRGVVPGVYDVAFNPFGDEAGRIYQQAWNYAVSYPTYGVVLEGQKTFQLAETALDRVNVRRLLIWLEKSAVAVARRFLYEGNTAYNRQRFVDALEPIFREAQVGDGLIDYAIRCDDELNPPEVIDRNELRCVCAVRPVKTIEWIRIDLICGNQRANVTEEVTRA